MWRSVIDVYNSFTALGEVDKILAIVIAVTSSIMLYIWKYCSNKKAREIANYNVVEDLCLYMRKICKEFRRDFLIDKEIFRIMMDIKEHLDGNLEGGISDEHRQHLLEKFEPCLTDIEALLKKNENSRRISDEDFKDCFRKHDVHIYIKICKQHIPD